ncbi:hypothetical protein SAMN06265349_102984 [Flavobacterium resistens]|uniref:Uncharacterized protein n=1 Tax=Flavobacterium resistens TaxID=443612 RepID=A0A521CW38_9FLAO|nr:hypothetical protein [Flavobacterium resistens]MRX67051.1 hypothetical protein [Flavobacterium resistens]SMO63643.1 hypothetical protein SAMN06265349_102984 [Flavobacterium resistens]
MTPAYKIDFQLILYILFSISFLILIPTFFVDHHKKTVALEKKLIEIEEEINSKEITYKKNKMEFEQRELKHKKEIERYKSDL